MVRRSRCCVWNTATEKAVEFTEEVARQLALAGWQEALELARGKRPGADHDRAIRGHRSHAAETPRDGGGWLGQVGDKIPGRILHARYSRYMQKIAAEAPELVDQLAETRVLGLRTTAQLRRPARYPLSLANNASNGIEPSFAHHYFRNVIRQGKKTKEKVDVYSFEMLAYRELVDKNAMPAGSGTEEGHKQLAGLLHHG